MTENNMLCYSLVMNNLHRKEAEKLIDTVAERLRTLADTFDKDDTEQLGSHLAMLSMADMLIAAKTMMTVTQL